MSANHPNSNWTKNRRGPQKDHVSEGNAEWNRWLMQHPGISTSLYVEHFRVEPKGFKKGAKIGSRFNSQLQV